MTIKKIVIVDFGLSCLPQDYTGNYLCESKAIGTGLYRAPETINLSYNQYDYDTNQWFKNDVWAVGVAYYFFIHRYSPFGAADDTMETLENDVENYVFSYDEQTGNSILTFSDECSDFSQAIIKTLLNPNYNNRLSANKILIEYFKQM